MGERMRYLRLLIASIKELDLQLLHPFYRCAGLLADVPALQSGTLGFYLISACPSNFEDMSAESEPQVQRGRPKQHQSTCPQLNTTLHIPWH